jgi:hypothetical protein
MDHVSDRHTNVFDDAAIRRRHLDHRLVCLQHQDDLVLVYRIANGHADVLELRFMDAFA